MSTKDEKETTLGERWRAFLVALTYAAFALPVIFAFVCPLLGDLYAKAVHGERRLVFRVSDLPAALKEKGVTAEGFLAEVAGSYRNIRRDVTGRASRSITIDEVAQQAQMPELPVAEGTVSLPALQNSIRVSLGLAQEVLLSVEERTMPASREKDKASEPATIGYEVQVVDLLRGDVESSGQSSRIEELVQPTALAVLRNVHPCAAIPKSVGHHPDPEFRRCLQSATTPSERASAFAAIGDAHAERGQFELARQDFTAGELEGEPDAGYYARWAQALWWSADLDEAEKKLELAEGKTSWFFTEGDGRIEAQVEYLRTAIDLQRALSGSGCTTGSARRDACKRMERIADSAGNDHENDADARNYFWQWLAANAYLKLATDCKGVGDEDSQKRLLRAMSNLPHWSELPLEYARQTLYADRAFKLDDPMSHDKRENIVRENLEQARRLGGQELDAETRTELCSLEERVKREDPLDCYARLEGDYPDFPWARINHAKRLCWCCRDIEAMAVLKPAGHTRNPPKSDIEKTIQSCMALCDNATREGESCAKR